MLSAKVLRVMAGGLLLAATSGIGEVAHAAEPQPGKAEQPSLIRAVRLDPAGRQLRIQTSGEPQFSVFRLANPFRILVDLAHTEFEDQDLSGVQGGPVKSVGIRALTDTKAVRVEIELERKLEYDVRAEGNSVVVRLGDGFETPQIGRLKLTSRGPKTILGAPLSGQLSSEAVRIETLASPPRLVVDVLGADLRPKWQRLRVGRHGVRRARAARRPDGARLVLDLEQDTDFPQVTVDVVGRRLQVGIETPKRAAVVETPAPGPKDPLDQIDPPIEAAEIEAPARAPKTPLDEVDPSEVVRAEPKALAPAPRPASPAPEVLPKVAVKNVRFEPKDGFYRLTVDLNGAAKEVGVVREGTESVPVLRVSSAALPKALERTMDVTAIAGEALSSVSTFQDGGDLIISARILDDTEHRHWRKDQRLMWDFRSSRPRIIEYEQESTASSFTTDASRAASTLLPQRKRYTGRRISLDLKDADIQNVLRLLADVSKLNIVASDDVKGKITIKLRNVPWDQALDIILRAKQLDKTRNGNIIRVAPLTVLQQEEELRLARLKAQVELQPLTVRLIPVSYAVATDVVPQVAALLTPDRGKVNVDKRTNVLIVEDIADVLTKVERLVRTLDTQTPQVLIEARIVEARSNFSRELGIQWGGNAAFTQSFGNQTGLTFPSDIRIAGGADDPQNQVTEGVLPNANYVVNLPAAVGSGGGGALGFVFGSLNGGTFLNLRLSAAEATGKIKIISAPKIVTLDNKEARILSGERIPITVLTANGPTTRFIDANIELRVVPHVTQDGSILMQIRAKKNELSDRIDFLGVPGVLTKEATTQMIVRDGDTAVLGGLYRRNTSENESYIPWLGKIPVLGWLFKTTTRNDSRDELLIFISPRIVNRSAALIAPE